MKVHRQITIALLAATLAWPSDVHRLWAKSVTADWGNPQVTIGIRGDNLELRRLGYRIEHFVLYQSILRGRVRQEKLCRIQLSARYFSGFEAKIYKSSEPTEYCLERFARLATDEIRQDEFERALDLTLVVVRAIAKNEQLASFYRLVGILQGSGSSSAARETFSLEPGSLSSITLEEMRRLIGDFRRLSSYAASANVGEDKARIRQALDPFFSEAHDQLAPSNSMPEDNQLGSLPRTVKTLSYEQRDQVLFIALVHSISAEEEKYVNAIIVRLCGLGGDKTFAGWLDGVGRTCFLHAIDGRSSWVFMRFQSLLSRGQSAQLRRHVEENVLAELSSFEVSLQKRKTVCGDPVESLLRSLKSDDCILGDKKFPFDGNYFLLEIEGATRS